MSIFDSQEVQDNSTAIHYYHSGDKEQAMIFFIKAASKGQPNALASLIWYQVLADKFDDAILNFDNYFPRVQGWIDTENARLSRGWFVNKAEVSEVIALYDYQKSNIMSNVAMAYLAKGDKKTALSLWVRAAQNHGHLEARFYPVLLNNRDDLDSLRATLKINFSKEELTELISTMRDIARESNGWFANWTKESLSILQAAANQKAPTNRNLGQAVAGTAAGVTGFDIAARKVAQNYFQEQASSEADSEGIFDWLGDLFN